MNRWVISIILLVLIGAWTLPAFCQQKLWDELQDKAILLYQQKKHQAAVDTQAEALRVAEATWGPEHINIVESLDNLAIYEQALEHYDIAEKLYERAVPLLEKNAKDNDTYLAMFLDYVGSFYKRIGKEEKAKELKDRARKLRGEVNKKAATVKEPEK